MTRTSETQIRVVGWSGDRNTTNPTTVVFYVDGKLQSGGTVANGSRPDVLANTGRGANTGFIRDLTIAPGAKSICVSAINQGPGDHTLLGCKNIPAWTPAPTTTTTTTIPAVPCELESDEESEDGGFYELAVSDCTIDNADFSGADFDEVTFTNVEFIDVSFDGAHLHPVTFENSSFTNVTFEETEIHEVTFSGVTAQNTTFDDAQFGEYGSVLIENSDLSGSTFVGASIDSTTFDNTKLHDVDMSDAWLYNNVEFRGTTSLLGLMTADGRGTMWTEIVTFDDDVECPDASTAADNPGTTCFGAGWDAEPAA